MCFQCIKESSGNIDNRTIHVGKIPVNVQGKADSDRKKKPDKRTENTADSPGKPWGGAKPVKIGSNTEQNQEKRQEYGYSGNDRSEKAMDQIAGEGRRGYDGQKQLSESTAP